MTCGKHCAGNCGCRAKMVTDVRKLCEGGKGWKRMYYVLGALLWLLRALGGEGNGCEEVG